MLPGPPEPDEKRLQDAEAKVEPPCGPAAKEEPPRCTEPEEEPPRGPEPEEEPPRSRGSTMERSGMGCSS